MTSNNPVIGSWLDVVFHLYMISCNLVKSSWQDIVFHSYMISNNPVIGSWLDIVFSFIYNYYMLQIFLTKLPLKKQKISH